MAARKALVGLLLVSGTVVRPPLVVAQESASSDTLVESLALRVHDLDQQLPKERGVQGDRVVQAGIRHRHGWVSSHKAILSI